MSLNRALVIGNLGGDPELRHLPSGQPVVGFSIATDEVYMDKQGQEQEHIEWHRVVAFGKLAETCGEYLKKGRQVVCCESFIGDGGAIPGLGARGSLRLGVVGRAMTAPTFTLPETNRHSRFRN